MNILDKYKDPKNLHELLEDHDTDFDEFKDWINNMPYDYCWWFSINERHIFLKYPTMNQAFYPVGLKYNCELLLYLLTHGFESFFKEFFKNYTKNNPDKLTLKQILQNRIDEIWFFEDKGKDEYVLSDELRVYLDDTRFKEIRNFSVEDGNKLFDLCKKEPKVIKNQKKYSPRSYYFVIQLLSEIVINGDKDLSDKAKLLIGEIFITETYAIYDDDVARKYFKELADDKTSKVRFKAAFLLAKNISFKNSTKEAERAIKYYKIATSEKDEGSIFYMMGLIYQHLEQHDETNNYFSKAAALNHKLAIEKCQQLNISF